jgi:hypothetical protein
MLGSLITCFAMVTDRNLLTKVPAPLGAALNGYYTSTGNAEKEMKNAMSNKFDRDLRKILPKFSGLGIDMKINMDEMILNNNLPGSQVCLNRVPIYWWSYIFDSAFIMSREQPSTGKPQLIEDEHMSTPQGLTVEISDYSGPGKPVFLTNGNTEGYAQPQMYIRTIDDWREPQVNFWRLSKPTTDETKTIAVVPTIDKRTGRPMRLVYNYNILIPEYIRNTFGSIIEPRDDLSAKKWLTKSEAVYDDIFGDSLNF